MAQFANPRKKFNWSIQITPEPINPFMFQKVNIPEGEIEPIAHGDTNHDIKTAGRVSYGNITAEKLLPSDSGDSYMWSWFDTCQSSMLGGGAPPDVYKKTIVITEFAEDGFTVLNTWTAIGCWPQRLGGLEKDRMSSENDIEEIEFSVDKLTKL